VTATAFARSDSATFAGARDGQRFELLAVAEFETGREIDGPIYDPDGRLLLAEGSVFSENFEEALRRRGIEHVLGVRPPTPADGSPSEAGAPPPAAKRLSARLSADRRLVEDSLECAARGLPRRIAGLSRQVDDYAEELTADRAALLAVATDVVPESGLADRCQRMSLLGMALVRELGWDEEAVSVTGLAGLLHDWGMIRVPAPIRDARKPLTPGDFLVIKRHPIFTLDLLRSLDGVPIRVARVCHQVHERRNGTGYPRGMSGDTIDPVARALHVADAYLGLTSPRPYRPALMPSAAVEHLVRQAADGAMDPQVVRALLQMLSLFPVGSRVQLSDGSVGEVVSTNGAEFARPVVRLEGAGRVEGSNEARDEADGMERIVDLLRSPLCIARALPRPGRGEIPLSPEVVNRNWKPPGEDDAAARVIAELDRIDAATQAGVWRRSARHALRTAVAVTPAGGATVRAWARDVSQRGMSFVHRGEIEAPVMTVRIGGVTFEAEVARRQPAGEGFWEYGVAFRRRVSGDGGGAA